jgi:hypothetical protein
LLLKDSYTLDAFALLNALIQIYRPIGELAAGAIYQYGANNVASINQILELAFPEIKQINLKGEAAANYLSGKYKWFRSGRMIGDGVTLYTALQEIEIGGFIGGAGAASFAETGGASVGLVVAGSAILVHGANAGGEALADLVKQMGIVFHSSSGEGNSESDTAERSSIQSHEEAGGHTDDRHEMSRIALIIILG